MLNISNERPGIFPKFDESSVYYKDDIKKKIGIAGIAEGETNRVYSVKRLADAQSMFGLSSTMYKICSFALENGAGELIVACVENEDPDYEAAFALLEAEDNIGIIICDSEDSEVHSLLKESVESASDLGKERIGIIAGASSISDYETWAEGFNSERIVLVAQNPKDENNTQLSSCFIAAAFAGIIAKSTDLLASFNGIKLNNITKLSQNLSEETVEDFISYGITPFEVVFDKAEIIRAVTSKTSTNNVSDKKYRDLNTILIVDTITSTIRKMLISNAVGSKNNSMTRASIASQTIIKLDEFKDKGIIESYEEPNVYLDTNNNTTCMVEIEFTVSKRLNQIKILAYISV